MATHQSDADGSDDDDDDDDDDATAAGDYDAVVIWRSLVTKPGRAS